MDFEAIYPKTSDDLKLKYLNAIIRGNDKLREEFMAFVEAENNKIPGLSFDHFSELIRSIQKDYLGYFETVDLENPDWDHYRPPYSGYIEDWEAYQYAGEQEFEAIFNNFAPGAVDKIIQQKADELVASLVGLYEATQDAEITDDIGSFGDVNEFLLSEHTGTMNGLIEKLSMSAVSGNIVINTFDLFFRYCDSEYPGNPHFAKHFEPLLIALAEKSDQADRLLASLDQSSVERSFMPELVLLLCKKTGNMDEWLKLALQFYRHSTAAAKQVMVYYFETNKEAFLRLAHELFPGDRQLWAGFLQQYVSPELDERLFVAVFRELTLHFREIGYYNKISEYLSATDFTELLDELKWDRVFAVRILEIEERYEEIKAMVEKHPDDRTYADLIAPILTVYPGFCFKHIKSKAENTLQFQRGRAVYERVASWLSLAGKVPGFEIETLDLVRTLYNHKPNLPALKDEMRKAGLV